MLETGSPIKIRGEVSDALICLVVHKLLSSLVTTSFLPIRIIGIFLTHLLWLLTLIFFAMWKAKLNGFVFLAVGMAYASAFSPVSLVSGNSSTRRTGKIFSEDQQTTPVAHTSTSLHAPVSISSRQSYTVLDAGRTDAPPLRRNPPRKICLMVEPTPFTHVSGYANRFKEMLKFMAKAGDKVDILTVDSKTPAKDLPKEAFGFPIQHTQGFTFPLYNHISLTLDLPEMKGAQIVENMKPDLIHVTSPYVLILEVIYLLKV